MEVEYLLDDLVEIARQRPVVPSNHHLTLEVEIEQPSAQHL